MKKIEDISFKTKLIVTIETLVILISIFISFVSYSNYKSLILQVPENKLLAIASSVASTIDAEKINAIQNESDTKSDNYLEIKKELKKIKETDSEIDDIYLMRKSVYQNILKFIANVTEEEDKNKNGIIEENEMGVDFDEEYDISSFPAMREAFNEVTVDKEIGCDKWGCWLSGYAPIKNDFGETIAIVGVDISAEKIFAYENQAKKMIFLTIGLISFIFPIFLFFFLQYMLKPINEIVGKISDFKNNLKTRINIKGNNEFGLIAKSFNEMALDLEILYSQMEKIVREKTKTLIEIAQRALEEKAKEEAFIDNAGEGMIATDKGGIIIKVNKQAEIILNKNNEEFLGKRIGEICDIEDEFEKKMPNWEKPTEKVLTTREKISGKYYYLYDDKKIPLFISASPVFCEDKIIGAISIFRDISVENEIDKAKTEFVSLASHQLRTPLSIINWHTEALYEDQSNFSETQKNYLTKIKIATKRMIDLVRALLNTYRLEMGSFSVENKEIDLVKLTKNVIEDLEPLCSIQNISFENNFSAEKIIFKGDPYLISMIFQNLLTNAVKYSKRNGKVFLEIMEEKTNIAIKVVDQGIGISKNQEKQIFTRFFRADNAREKDAEGTGLGLYIIKKIIESFGGVISFESTENKGTVFTVILPKNKIIEKKNIRKII